MVPSHVRWYGIEQSDGLTSVVVYAISVEHAQHTLPYPLAGGGVLEAGFGPHRAALEYILVNHDQLLAAAHGLNLDLTRRL